jgi:hypothetical protein
MPDVGELLNAQRIEFQRIMITEGLTLACIALVLWRFGFVRGKRAARQEQPQRVEATRDDERLLQAVDAIAIEVERLSEGQRFLNNIMASRKPEREALPVTPRTGNTPNDGSRITPH